MESTKFLEELAELARKKKVDVTITVSADGTEECRISPYQPIKYACPYSAMCDGKDKRQ